MKNYGQLISLAALALAAAMPLGAATNSVKKTKSFANASVKDPPAKAPEGKKGDPVGVITGSIFDRATDILVEAPGVELAFNRIYSSSDVYAAGLGPGWSHTYSWRLFPGDGSTVRLHAGADEATPDGRGWDHSFRRNADGSYAPSPRGRYLLSRSDDGNYRLVSPDDLVRVFASDGRLLSVAAPTGESIALAYDAANRLVAATHSCGSALDLVRDGAGRIASVTVRGTSVSVAFAYDADGCLVRAERRGDAEPTAYGYAYDEIVTNRPKKDPASRIIGTPIRTSSSRRVLVAKTFSDGATVRYESFRPTDSPAVKCSRSVFDDGLFDTRLSYSEGLTEVTRFTAAGTVVERHAYDPATLRPLAESCGDESRAYAYDAQGNVARETVSNALTGASSEIRRTWSPDRRPLTETVSFCGGEPFATEMEWNDEWNVPTRLASPGGRVRAWSRDRENGTNVVTVACESGDGLQRVTRLVCGTDDWRLASVRGPDGAHTDFVRGTDGRIVAIETEGLPRVALSYDALGRVASVARPGPGGTERRETCERDRAGNVTRATDALGNVSEFAYLAGSSRVTRTVDPLGRTNEYGWVLGRRVLSRAGTNVLWTVTHDRELNVVSVGDPLGRAAESYSLDALGRVTAVTNLEGQAMTVDYLLGDRRSHVRRFDGTEVAYEYAPCGEVSRVAWPNGTADEFAYDRDGLLTVAANGTGIVSNAYDGVTGDLVLTRGADGTDVSFVRSDGGAVTALVSVAGTERRVFDAAGRRTCVDSPAGTVRFAHCPWNGLVASVTNANGTVAAYEYDLADRVTNMMWKTASGVTLGGFGYVYDAAGRIVRRTVRFGSETVVSDYGYDDRDRLVSADVVTYAYDAADNRIAKRGGVEGDVVYALGQGDRLASWTGGAYGYDAAGCVTRVTRGAEVLDLAWDAAYRLVSVSRNGVVIESYAYDALGRRVATTTANGTERHVYDDNWQVIADLDANGNVLRSYVWDAGIDRLLAVKIGSRTYTAHTDVQGTVWAFSDEQGNVAALFGYDAWGNVVSRTYAPGAEALAGVRYGFQGREHSQLTGFIHFRMRWYDPVTGRWLSKDPIRLQGGMNLYAFCGCDPVNHRDPIGADDEGQGVVSNIVVKVSPEYWNGNAATIRFLTERDIEEISQDKALQDQLRKIEGKTKESANWWTRFMNFLFPSGDSSGKGDADNNEKKPNMAPKKTKGGVK